MSAAELTLGRGVTTYEHGCFNLVATEPSGREISKWPPETDSPGVGEDDAPAWMVLFDVRETQPDERLHTDGKMDHPLISIVGSDQGLCLLISSGTKTPPESEAGPMQMFIDREQFQNVLPDLAHWAETGEWKRAADCVTQIPPGLFGDEAGGGA